jgi:AraC family transcriptional regulator
MQTNRLRAAHTIAPRQIRRREVGDLTLSECTYPPGLRMPKHDHEPAYFSLVLRGSYTETIETKELAAQPSSLVAHPPGRAHAVAFHEREVRIFRVDVKPRWLERLREYSVDLNVPACFRGGAPVALALRLYGEFRAADKYSPLTIEGIALELVAEISRRCEREREHRVPPWLERAREILHEQVGAIPTLASLASEVGVHPVHLAHEFRKFYRESVGEYARRRRIETACREIVQSARSLSEIASDAGFYDQSHFSNTFKRHTGLTPAAFRAATRSN